MCRCNKKKFLYCCGRIGIDNAPRFSAFATTQDRLLYQLKNEHRQMYAYCENYDKIIGYYSLELQDNNQCELNNLCVLPQYRHKHIGTNMLEDACIKAKKAGCKKINIGIVEENKVLKNWYVENGFIHTGTKKFDFFPFTCGYMEMDL